MSRDLANADNEMVMCFYEYEIVKVSYNPVRFSGHSLFLVELYHRLCDSGDIIILVAEEEVSNALASIWHYCLSLKDMT